MIAVGEHAPAVDHDDLVSERNRREPMGDDEGRPPGHRRLRGGDSPAPREAAGADAALRVHCLELDSRVPERRVMLTPFES